MPLSPPVLRQQRHRRAINVDAFERDDGLWDIEARLTDHKSRDVTLAVGTRAQGLPVHDLWLRLTIDLTMNIVDAEASSDWVPYPTHCDAVAPAYRELIGLNLLKNFRRASLERLGGTAGCTHLTELCAVLPTAAIQAFSGDVWNRNKVIDSGKRTGGAEPSGEHPGPAGVPAEAPFHLDRCHALRFSGAVVKEFYPDWYGSAPRSAYAGRALAARAASEAPADASRQRGEEVQSTSQTEGNHA